MTLPQPSLSHEFASALAWWQMAGVDCDFHDDARAWLGERPSAKAPMEAQSGLPPRERATRSPDAATPQTGQSAAPAAIAPTLPATPRRDWLGESPPADLAAFQKWWMEAPDLSPSRGFPRVPPRGGHGAKLMVLVPQPEAGDSERLLSGPQGRLLDAILAAMGLGENAIYIAAALPSHTPMADLPAIAAGGMDAVTAHHIGLVAPARVLAFGTGLAAMLGAPQNPLGEINHTGRKIPASLSETLDALMEMPRLKARFWRRWMEWSATD
jgi:DNA polymerase